MAYLIKLGERPSARPTPASVLPGWISHLQDRRPVLIAVLAVGILSIGAVIYQAQPHSVVIAREDPDSAQEIADDSGRSNAIAANGEVADDSQASRSAYAR